MRHSPGTRLAVPRASLLVGGAVTSAPHTDTPGQRLTPSTETSPGLAPGGDAELSAATAAPAAPQQLVLPCDARPSHTQSKRQLGSPQRREEQRFASAGPTYRLPGEMPCRRRLVTAGGGCTPGLCCRRLFGTGELPPQTTGSASRVLAIKQNYCQQL